MRQKEAFGALGYLSGSPVIAADVPPGERFALMAEVADAGEQHGDAGGVGGGDDLLVAHAAARLDGGGGAGVDGGSRPSGNGKNASEATTQGRLPAFAPARRTARSTASTRLVWPMPMPTVAPSRASTMALDLTCLTTVQAKRRSASSAVGGRPAGDDSGGRVGQELRGVAVLDQEAAGERT